MFKRDPHSFAQIILPPSGLETGVKVEFVAKKLSGYAHDVLFSKFSTAKRWLIKQHVLAELSGCKLKWQDFTLRDFTDPFLREHVDFIAICDTDPCMLEVVKF